MRRPSFLTWFFTALAIVFAIALAQRIGSYSGEPENQARTSTVEPATVATEKAADPVAPPVTDTTITIVDTARAAESRAQQRARLLREVQAQPSTASAAQTASPPAKEKPGLLSRIIAPVVNAVRPAPSPPQPRPAQPSAPQVQPSVSSPPNTTSNAQTGDPKDPNSDSAAPQLVAIEFDPPQVHDGEEARVVLTAVDDLSGVRGISGTVTSPTGKALQGFAGQREGDGNRFIGRLTIPKNGEEGLWRVNVVTMSDNASNSVTLSHAQGTVPATAVLRVLSSASDSTAPTLRSVRPQKRSMQVGEANPIYIEADDDKSGVKLVSAVFQSPNKRARIGAGCRRSESEVWVCELSLPQCIDCGEWQLEQVTLQDKANNLATFRADNPIVADVRVSIGGQSCDSEPPKLQGLTVDPPVVVMGETATFVTVTVVATDDSCGVSGVSGQYAGPNPGSGGFFPLQQAGDATTWVGRVPLDARAARGVWRITSVQITDKGHNLRIYYANDPMLTNATFQLR